MTKFIGVALLFFLAVPACRRNPSPVSPHDQPLQELTLDSTVNGRQVSSLPHQRITLDLAVLADAGYQWVLSLTDTNVVRIDSASFRPVGGNWNQVGGLTIETIVFEAIRSGECLVSLDQRRVWEPGVPPIQSVRFTLVVAAAGG